LRAEEEEEEEEEEGSDSLGGYTIYMQYIVRYTV
jgi:hypothetical protein